MRYQDLKDVQSIKTCTIAGRSMSGGTLCYAVTRERNGFAIWRIMDDESVEWDEPLVWLMREAAAKRQALGLAQGHIGVSRGRG